MNDHATIEAPTTSPDSQTETEQQSGIPRSLFAFSVFYGGMVCIAGVLANKQVAIGPLEVEAGIFAFIILVMLSSAVAELHGRAAANRLVAFGFAPLVFSILLALFVLALPAAQNDPARLDAFNTIMLATPRIWLAGIAAYGVGQFLNVYLFSKLTAATGQWIALRGVIAGVLSQLVDTVIFITGSFYGEFPIMDLLIGQSIAKVVLAMVVVPVLIVFIVRFGRWIDRHDP
ncbi:queuosine precursor transporter [Alterisphingorhabdus coralli]|uniref:Probable queuosine precursor transporter n=1 Tax=Alterisphingorhabdus coralli TaxID=3071408 RepID=A0AA97F783_9SPHN|nr:queuosine precursor transporter [Parasphingorhabdus sp. SCSIO 66989]WOE75654.1 queuosine precursor transporter [Parasphingorhabdus sp. SCSIO 66989]